MPTWNHNAQCELCGQGNYDNWPSTQQVQCMMHRHVTQATSDVIIPQTMSTILHMFIVIFSEQVEFLVIEHYFIKNSL